MIGRLAVRLSAERSSNNVLVWDGLIGLAVVRYYHTGVAHEPAEKKPVHEPPEAEHRVRRAGLIARPKAQASRKPAPPVPGCHHTMSYEIRHGLRPCDRPPTPPAVAVSEGAEPVRSTSRTTAQSSSPAQVSSSPAVPRPRVRRSSRREAFPPRRILLRSCLRRPRGVDELSVAWTSPIDAECIDWRERSPRARCGGVLPRRHCATLLYHAPLLAAAAASVIVYAAAVQLRRQS